MAMEPDDFVLSILREIQSTLADQTRMHRQHAEEFRKVHQEIADFGETTTSAAGLTVHANVKTVTLQTQFDAIHERLNLLERKVEKVEQKVEKEI